MSLINNFTPVPTDLVTQTTEMMYESTTPAVLVTNRASNESKTSTPRLGGTDEYVAPFPPFYWFIIPIGVVIFMLIFGCCYLKLKRNRNQPSEEQNGMELPIIKPNSQQ